MRLNLRTFAPALALAALAAAASGWLLRRTTVLERILLVISGLALVYPSTGPDLIATAVRVLSAAGDECVIVSADKDFGQCVGGPVTQLAPPPTANPALGWRRLDPAAVVHVRRFNPVDDHYGLGCLGAAAGAIAAFGEGNSSPAQCGKH